MSDRTPTSVERSDAAEPPLTRAFATLHRHALGTGVGVALGTIVFAATLASMKRDPYPARHLGLLSQFFLGYSVSLSGAFIGLAWAFFAGYAFGWLFALLRNVAIWVYLVRIRMHTEMEQYAGFLDHM
jgi:hypothetical protein